MRKYTIFILCIFLVSCATASSGAKFHRQAVTLAKQRNYDAAFLKLRALLNDNPHSAYARRAAFAVAEYYFQSGDYLDATVAFRRYINAYPEDESVIFAELMIYKMATEKGSNKNIPFNERYLLENIREKMFQKPVFIIFKEKRESFSYTSDFGNNYTAFDHIDKISITRNGKLFFELTP
jgi:outer membrane protein assembly factor BamD (BamD/ComL family)